MPNKNAKRSSAEIYTILRNKIQFLEIAPGSTIHEADLAVQMGVSRTPVREALIRLSDELLVETYPQSGTYVTKIDIEHVKELIYMRHVLERDVLTCICKKGTRLNGRLTENLLMQKLAVDNNNVIDFIHNDDQYHGILFAYAEHGHIWAQIQNTRPHHTRYRVIDMELTGSLEASYQEHLSIARFIEEGNRSDLLQQLVKHHDCGLAKRAQVVACHPDYFT